MKVIILGGGASGLMAALSAARDARNTVTILERQSRVGRKLLATGNSRGGHYIIMYQALTVPSGLKTGSLPR